MTGLEKMKSQILSEARALADNKVEEAKADAHKSGRGRSREIK